MTEFRNLIPEFVREYLSDVPLKEYNWKLVDIREEKEKERVWLLVLDRDVDNEKIASITNTDTKIPTTAVVFTESLLGNLLKIVVEREYASSSSTIVSGSKKRVYFDNETAFNDLSVYFSNLPTLTRCRTAVANVLALAAALCVFFVGMWYYLRCIWLWPIFYQKLAPICRIVVFVLLNFACLRILLGVNYLSFDRTFNEVFSIVTRRFGILAVRLGRLVLQLSAILLPIAILGDWPWMVAGSLVALANVPVILLYFLNEALWKESESSKNWLFYVNDGLFCIAGNIIGFKIFWECFGNKSDWGSQTVEHYTTIFFTAIICIFMAVEIFSIYRQSIASAIRMAAKFCVKVNIR